jgi:hypothetical protein
MDKTSQCRSGGIPGRPGLPELTRDVLCYVQRRRISDWKRQVFREKEPLFMFGSNDRRVFARLHPGDRLWIVATRGDGLPSLTARIIVGRAGPFGDPALGIPEHRMHAFREWKWMIRGAEGSEFYGHNDASDALLGTVYCSASGRSRMLAPEGGPWKSTLGTRLQGPALICPAGKLHGEIASPGSAPLEALAARKKFSVFISYKWQDQNRALVRSLADALARSGLMPWLDQLALPGARASARIAQDEPLLRRLLHYGYGQCPLLLGLYSPHYGVQTGEHTGNWSRREWRNDLGATSPKIKVLYNPDRLEASTLVADRYTELTQPGFDELAAELKRIFLQGEVHSSG